MNWLAHLLLSKRDVEYQIGNFLADPLKGRVWEGASKSLEQGMLMHKSIDIYTDSHEVVLMSKSRLGKKGYLKGVIIDLLYDHYLSADWAAYSSVSQSSFLLSFYTGATQVVSSYPEEVKTIVTRLVESDKLARYQEFEGFVEALHRIEGRLSPRIKAKDSALNYIGVVEQQYSALKSDFEVFFPALIEFFKHHEFGSVKDNYLVVV